MEKGIWLDELYENEAAALALCALARKGQLKELISLLPEIAKEQKR